MFSFSELRAKQLSVMGKVMQRGAMSLQARLVAEVKDYAENNESIKGHAFVIGKADGIKSLRGNDGKGGAQAKVVEKYGGEWLDIMDFARCTLVIDHTMHLEPALRGLRARFVVSNNGFSVVRDKMTHADEDPGGYSGCTINVTSGGNKGEIQVNTPAMMYAKSLPEFRGVMGDLEPGIKAKYPMVPGGLGHEMYENFRNRRNTPLGLEIMEASKHYYNYFRSDPPDRHLGLLARAALEGVLMYVPTRPRR